MKIALISQEYPPESARGGIGTQTYIKAQGLSHLGHQVFVISQSPGTNRYEVIDGNICVIRIPEMEGKIPEMTDIVYWITHSVVVAAEIEALHRRIGLDIVDFPEWAAEGYTYFLNRMKENYVPAIIQLHGPLVMFGHVLDWPATHSAFYKVGTHMEATCIQLADAVYSSSECSANWVREHYQPKKKTIPVIHLGIDTIKFAPQPVPKNQFFTIVFIGKIVQNKGVEELVEAASNLVKRIPDLRLRLIGRGDKNWIDYLKNKAISLGAINLLEFPGFVHRDDLPAELSRAHVFAAPSWYEGGPGFVYLEAMACGLPVIGCNGSGIDEVVDSGRNGILVPPKDAKSLEEALFCILNNKKILTEMGEAARAYVLQEADSQYCLDKLEKFYYSIVQSKKVELEIV